MSLDLINRFGLDFNQIFGLENLLAERFNGRVQHGPFMGMRIENRSVWCDLNLTTKFIGCYEFELHAAVEKAIARNPDTIINAGCAEGYYTVGFGRRLPRAQLFAMDKNVECLAQCERNAALNGIIKMATVEGEVGPQDLIRGDGKKLYIVDIEGYEMSVLNPELCADLYTNDIIVECHDFLFCDIHEDLTIISDELERRFRATHDVQRIEPRLPHLGDYPCVSGMVMGSALLAITEKRPYPTSWLAMWAKERRH